MGFYVNIDSDKARILRNLRLSPTEVFGKPYGGYLLFLVGSADEDTLTWFSKNATILDSLTGEHIAFGIFARSLKLKLRVPDDSERKTSERARVIDVPLHEIRNARSITDLVKSGRCGWVMDGDEINAITYGTDEVARAFGVMGELPCMLVMDAVPKKNFEVFHLDSKTTPALIGMLRRSIQNLIEKPNYDTYMTTIRRVVQLQRDANSVLGQINQLKSQRDSLTNEPYIEPVRQLIPEFRSSLTSGNLSRFTSLCKKHKVKSVIDETQLALAVSTAKKHIETLLAYTQTIHRLYLYAKEYKWPLEEPWLSKYLTVYQKYTRPLLDNAPENPTLDSPTECEKFREQLINQQSKLVDEIMATLPSVSILEDEARKLIDKKKALLDQQIEDLLEAKQGIESQLKQSVAELYQLEQPSFIKCFTKEAQKERIKSATRQVRDSAATYAGSWLRPETIIEIWKSLATP